MKKTIMNSHTLPVLYWLVLVMYFVTGFKGIDDNLPVEKRAELYGVKIGDLVEFTRYDGKPPRKEEGAGLYRMIQDQHIIGAYDV